MVDATIVHIINSMKTADWQPKACLTIERPNLIMFNYGSASCRNLRQNAVLYIFTPPFKFITCRCLGVLLFFFQK